MFGASGGGAGVSVALQWKLLDRTFATQNPWFAMAQICIFSTSAWICTHSSLPLIWGAVSLAIMPSRILLARAYAAAGEREPPDVWARRLTVCLTATGAMLGILGLSIVLVANPLLHLLVVVAQASFLFAVAAQNSCLPRAACLQVLLVKLPLAAACFLTLNPVYLIVGIGTLLETAGMCWRIEVLHGHIVRELEYSEQITQARDELEDATRQLAELATTDGLTGLSNRRGFDLAFRREWRRALREHLQLSLLLIDLDHFKLLNDALGHSAGDACLAEVARIIAATAQRPGDVPARYGGEEFAVVMPDTDSHTARFMAERLRAAIAARALAHPASRAGRVTASVGASTIIPDETTLPTLLVEQADSALYRAKASGRDCVCVFEPLRPLAQDHEQEASARPAPEAIADPLTAMPHLSRAGVDHAGAS